MKKIINKVENNKLITIDIESFLNEKKIILLDIKKWLYNGIFFKEKIFRKLLKEHNWDQYKNSYVTINCSSKVILPSWIFMLINIYLEPFALKITYGNIEFLEYIIYKDVIKKMDIKIYENSNIIIKGCTKKNVPINAYLYLIKKLKPFVNSIMYGGACSLIPLFKKKYIKN